MISGTCGHQSSTSMVTVDSCSIGDFGLGATIVEFYAVKGREAQFPIATTTTTSQTQRMHEISTELLTDQLTKYAHLAINI